MLYYLGYFSYAHYCVLSFQEPFQVKVSSEALLIMDLVRIKFYFQKIMTYMLWSWFFNGQHKMVET